MYNTQKLSLAKKLIFVAIGFLLLLVGFLIGTSVSSKTTKSIQPEVKQVKKEVKQKNELTTKDVNNFLVAYYTKKDLGENQNRYKPLVTDTMFTELISEEEEPVNQAYKGYIVNQVFDRADIYVDVKNSTAIAIVTYKNTQRSTKGTDENALINQSHSEAIKLVFQKVGKNYLVNRFSYVALSEPLSDPKNTYKAVNSAEGFQNVPLEDEQSRDTSIETETTKKDLTEENATTESTTSEGESK